MEKYLSSIERIKVEALGFQRATCALHCITYYINKMMMMMTIIIIKYKGIYRSSVLIKISNN